jgi:hypothetical protein
MDGWVAAIYQQPAVHCLGRLIDDDEQRDNSSLSGASSRGPDLGGTFMKKAVAVPPYADARAIRAPALRRGRCATRHRTTIVLGTALLPGKTYSSKLSSPAPEPSGRPAMSVRTGYCGASSPGSFGFGLAEKALPPPPSWGRQPVATARRGIGSLQPKIPVEKEKRLF